MPGFVDPHTHLVFAGERSGRVRVSSGRGLVSRHSASRGRHRRDRGGDPTGNIRRAARRRRWAGPATMLEHGTTTVEIKSGYGLDVETEIRCLEVARKVGDTLPIDVVTTFLGAHQVPPEFVGRPQRVPPPDRTRHASDRFPSGELLRRVLRPRRVHRRRSPARARGGSPIRLEAETACQPAR